MFRFNSVITNKNSKSFKIWIKTGCVETASFFIMLGFISLKVVFEICHFDGYEKNLIHVFISSIIKQEWFFRHSSIRMKTGSMLENIQTCWQDSSRQYYVEGVQVGNNANIGRNMFRLGNYADKLIKLW